MMWAFIFIFMFAAFIAACIYLITRVRKIALVDKLAKDRKWLSILISALTCVHSSFKSGYGVYQRNHSHDLHDIVLACL